MRAQKLAIRNHNNVVVLVLFAFFTTTSVAWTTSNRLGNETDRLALLAIKGEIVDGPFQTLKSWNDSLHFCQWEGVSCGRKHQRVTRLDLRSLKLEGLISPSIANLSFVRVINLSNNSFHGEIPREMSRLFRLRQLVLANNLLVGQIPPNLSFCSDLRAIHLWHNNLQGKIPTEIGFLSRLGILTLASNNLTRNIPPHLGNLSSLLLLDLVNNQLEGHIPDSLGQLKNLEWFQISSNYLSGTIPQSIYNLSQIRYFYISDNYIEGQIPRDIGLKLPSMKEFSVAMNKLGGLLPVSFANMSNLSLLQLSVNDFFGGVPDIFGKLKNLTQLQMDSTNLGFGNASDLDFFAALKNCSNMMKIGIFESNFGGSFPSAVANFSKRLNYLEIGWNLISGNIPSGIGNLVSLSQFGVQNNLLSGTIPATIGKLKELEKLSLSSNRFSGEIPSSLGNLTSLLELRLNDNNLLGRIPSSLESCKTLNLLDLSNNTLNGTIPHVVISLPSLSIVLNLSRNHLDGSLPSEVGELKNLGQLDISHNLFSNVIPPSIGECKVLRVLNMDHNMFEGTIPTSLSSLKGIEQIDLSHNSLSGPIPKGIARLGALSKLDISFNDLEGELPIGGVFSNASKISVTGNPKLCGGVPQLRLQVCTKEKSSFHGGGKLIIFVVFGILAISLMLYFLLTWWFKKKRKQHIETLPANPFASISYGDLLKATDGFSSENLIGVGSTGSVYKGVLEADQTAIAVKVFNLEKRGASKSFASECETLRGVRHRNLVKVITACSSIDYQGNEFKALVYELMPNGNLENLLHMIPQTEDQSTLTLSKRIDIAIDVASAVDYLHNNVETPILHCDLKPSNILLDEENVAHVGDFGLSRIVPEENAEISNTQSSSSGLKGTIGYAAPEYGMGSKVSREGDVYSFGILLLEMLTGKKPTDSHFGEGMNLNQYVKSALPEKVTEIVDQDIIPREEGEATRNNMVEQRRSMKISECCVSVLKIGVACSDEFPRARLRIDEALKQLYAAKKMLL